ncbi:unnamed protein product [Psylliodes chrysocephalus]|uniref:Protein kinase domain-containing protein n=1 Tax=Psylliodes chrysocephalus TaxID=3402493 RepID=A0A9P0CNC4_9CUCU|nr:unnamed protein product [Psylliodes chrysocephala]
MSSTEDFTGQRKTNVENTLFLRGTRSAVKKRPFFPKELIAPLVPLDLNAIRRELLEAEKEESAKYAEESDSIKENGEDILNLPCDIKTKKGIEASKASKENFQPIKKVISRENNSSDLVFSPLSLQTPWKKYTPFKRPDAKKNYCDENVENDRFNKFLTSTNKKINTPKFISTFKQEEIIPEVNKNNILCSIPRKVPENNIHSKIIINNVEYMVLNILGKGGSAIVYQCFCIEEKTIVAIKCVNLEKINMAQEYINEVKLLQRLQNCDRIIKLYAYQFFEGEKQLFMVLEKGGNDFSTVLKNLASQEKNIPLYMLIFYWMEMLLAVKQIHDNGVIHSDLKPSNFISGNMGLKLIDFGIACSVQSDMTSAFKTVPEGSCNYMSPEALNNDANSPSKSNYKLHYKSDVWSLGCILYELVYKKTPFQHIKTIWVKFSHITNPQHTIEYPEAKWLPPKVIDTIKKCLQYNVRARPSVDELIAEFENF